MVDIDAARLPETLDVYYPAEARRFERDWSEGRFSRRVTHIRFDFAAEASWRDTIRAVVKLEDVRDGRMFVRELEDRVWSYATSQTTVVWEPYPKQSRFYAGLTRLCAPTIDVMDEERSGHTWATPRKRKYWRT